MCPDVYLSATKRIRDDSGLVVVEQYDVVLGWIAEKKPVTLSAEAWLLDVTGVGGLNPATHTPIGGTNFPYAELDYDDAQEEYSAWRFALPPNFDPDEDIIFRLFWKSGTVIVGDVLWGIAVLGRTEGDDIAAAALGANVQVVATVQGVVEQLTVTEITLTPAEHDLDPHDMVIVFVTREGGDAADTLIGDAHLVMVKVDIAIDPSVLIEGMP